MKRKKLLASIALNFSVCSFSLLSLTRDFKKNGVGALLYYTELANLLGGVSSLVYCAFALKKLVGNRKIPRAVEALRYSATLSLAVTFLVVFSFLAPEGGLEGYKAVFFYDTMLFTHLLCPVMSLISFWRFEDNSSFPAVVAALPTLFYGATMLLLNFLRVTEGPYPFFFVYLSPLLSVVCCPLILFATLLLALLLKRVKRGCRAIGEQALNALKKKPRERRKRAYSFINPHTAKNSRSLLKRKSGEP